MYLTITQDKWLLNLSTLSSSVNSFLEKGELSHWAVIFNEHFSLPHSRISNTGLGLGLGGSIPKCWSQSYIRFLRIDSSADTKKGISFSFSLLHCTLCISSKSRTVCANNVCCEQILVHVLCASLLLFCTQTTHASC